MAIISLRELAFLNRQLSFPLGNPVTLTNSLPHKQFQLLVKQKRIGLNIEPLLNDRLSICLEQLEHFIPGLFDSRKKIHLDTKWQARLILKEADYRLEIPINAGVVNVTPRTRGIGFIADRYLSKCGLKHTDLERNLSPHSLRHIAGTLSLQQRGWIC